MELTKPTKRRFRQLVCKPPPAQPGAGLTSPAPRPDPRLRSPYRVLHARLKDNTSQVRRRVSEVH